MHLIQTIRAELSAFSKAGGRDAGERLSRAIGEHLSEALARRLDELVPGDTTLRIDTLELDLGILPARVDPGELATLIASRLGTLVGRVADAPLPPPSGQRSPVEELEGLKSGRFKFPPGDREGRTAYESEEAMAAPERNDAAGEYLEALLFYLEHGELPWWFALERWREGSPEFLREEGRLEAFEARLPELARRNREALIRLLAYPELIEALGDRRTGLLSEAVKGMSASPGLALRLKLAAVVLELSGTRIASGFSGEESHGTAVFDRLLLQDAASLTELRRLRAQLERGPEQASKSAEAILWDLLDSADRSEESGVLSQDSESPGVEKQGREEGRPTPESTERPERGARADERAERREDEGAPSSEALPTESAGLVLLWPWLANLFKALAWLDSGSRFLPGREWSAVQALRVLAHGRPARDEAELVLEKTLCGIPLPTAGELPDLDEEIGRELQALLEAVIANWPVLKNTSPDGLRESFLQRPGLLDLSSEAPELRVETRPYDLLLQRLPWGIELVALPWLPTPLNVVWPVSS